MVSRGGTALTLPIQTDGTERLRWARVALLGLLTVSALVNGDAKVALLGHPDRHFGILTWMLLFALFCAWQQVVEQFTTLTRAAVVVMRSLSA